MKYRNYVIRRVLFLIPMIFGISFITWFLSDIAGDPLAPYVSPNTILTEELEAELRERYGLNRPWPIRYLEYMLNLVEGDWGNSYALSIYKGIPVISLLQTALPATVELGLTAMIIVLIIGIPAGIYTARGKRKKVNIMFNGISIVGMAIPSFLLAILVQYLIIQIFFTLGSTVNSHLMDWAPYHFRYNIWQLTYPDRILFGLLPTTGFLMIDSLLAPDLILFFDAFIHLIVPASIIAFSQVLLITRMTRNAMVEVLKEDYILLAKAKGLTERVIIYRHAFKNAAVQVTTIVSIVLANLLTGVIFVEIVYSWPGLGTFMLAGVKSLDMPTINGIVIFATFIYVFINLAVDILYGFIDPRIRK